MNSKLTENTNRRTVNLDGRMVNCGFLPWVVCEIGCNFEGDLGRARQMISAAKEGGADAVKFQTFTAEKLTTRKAEKFWEIEGCPGQTQYEELSQMPSLSLEEYRDLQEHAGREGITFFSTPEDEDSADLLQQLDIPVYKISSMNITHHPLLRHVAAKGKPVLLSTGASTPAEIATAVEVVEHEGNLHLVLLHCITNYPTDFRNANIRMIQGLMDLFPQYPIGYSDHTRPDPATAVPLAATLLGAAVIEKHFTFDKSRPGYDHAISFDYDDLREFTQSLKTVFDALGSHRKEPVASEERARLHARRSLTAARNIKSREIISREDIEVKRPGEGIEPRYRDLIIGRTARRDITEDQTITWDDV